MARNVNIDNPTRVAIATVEDQNKYQMARNRNVDQVNQVFDNNVNPVAKESNLLKLANALKNNSSELMKFFEQKTVEKDAQITAQAEQDAMKMGLGNEAAVKHAEDKGSLYKKAFLTITGLNNASKDYSEAELKYLQSPDKTGLNITGIVAEQVAKNKGIDDPYYLTAYNQKIKPVFDKLVNLQTQEKAEEFLNTSRSKLLEDITLNKLNLSDIYTNGNMLGLDNKNVKVVLEQHLKDAEDNGDFETVNKLKDQMINYADAKGFKPYAGMQNSLDKMSFNAMRNYGAKVEMEQKIRDNLLVKADNEEWQSMVPRLRDETDPSKIDKEVRAWEMKMLQYGMSPQEIAQRRNLLTGFLSPKEPDVEQSLFENEIQYQMVLGKNPLGGNPLQTLEDLVRGGKITRKQSSKIWTEFLQKTSTDIRTAESEARQDSRSANAQAKALASEEKRLMIQNKNYILGEARSALNSTLTLSVNTLDDRKVSLINPSSKAGNDLTKAIGGQGFAELQSKYQRELIEASKEPDVLKLQAKVAEIRARAKEEFTSEAILLNRGMQQFDKLKDSGRLKALTVKLVEAEKKGKTAVDELDKTLTATERSALVIYRKQHKTWDALDAEKKVQQQEQTKKTKIDVRN